MILENQINISYSSMNENQKRFIQSQSYYELSQIVQLSYKSVPEISVLAEVQQIHEWVSTNNSKPLLISSQPLGGKKTLIWQYIKEKNQNIIISQFGCVNSSYSSILYRIMIKLRNILNINQQIQLNQEKLRRYFHYWLQTASNEIDKTYIGYSEEEKKKIIVIIEGVDQIVDSKNNTVLPFFWLPKTVPKNVKLILTSNTNSHICNILKEASSHHIHHHLNNEKLELVKKGILDNDFLKQNHKKNNFSLSELKLTVKILQNNQLFNLGEEAKNFEDFLMSFIEFISSDKLTVEVVLKLLGSLSISSKGLCKQMLKKMNKLHTSTITQFFLHFEPIIIHFDSFYLINDKTCKNAITSLMQKHEPKNSCSIKILHHSIAKTMKKLTMSTHNLEERIHHLLSCKNYTQLKEVLSRIQHFLILYTPLSKQLLCICWFHLQIQFQYDLVFQYNKSMERFLNNYYPTPQDIFKIIFQLSLFFKEYSQFQNSKTPKFRHPPIRGQAQQLRQISLYDELVNMGMYQKCKQKKTQKINNSSHSSHSNHEEIKQVQKLNVKIKFHQQKFQNFYLQSMRPFINEYCLFTKKAKKNNSSLLDEDSDQSDRQFDENKISLQKIKQKLLLKNYSEYGEEQYHRLGQKKTYYYYKQWIWMQFPWISQSINNNFSQQIFHCMKSPTQFMSIDEEFKNIQSAVKIAKIARNNKKQIFQEKEIQISPITTKLLFRKTGSFTEISQCVNKKKSERRKITKKRTILNNIKVRQSSESKNKETSLVYQRDASNTFLTNVQLNKSYSGNELLQSSRVKRLPLIESKLSQSKKWLSKNKNHNSKSEFSIVSKINQLKNQNNKLIKNIQEMKKNKENLQNNLFEPKLTEMKEKLYNLKSQNDKVQKMYKAEELLKGKLQTIIKLCDINKSHGSESADLSNFLSSLKYMTKIQSQNIQKLQAKGKKIIQQNRQQIRQLKLQKEREKERLRAKKKGKQIQKSTKQIKSVKHLTVKNQDKVHKGLKKKKVPEKDEEKKKVLFEQQLQKMKRIEEDFAKNFNIVYGQNQKNEQILNEIQYSFSKNRELTWKLKDIRQENDRKSKVLATLQEKAEQLSNRKEYNIEKSLRQDVSNLQQRKKQQIQRRQLLKKCLKLFETQ